MTKDKVSTGAGLGISGVLEFRDKDGNVVGTTELRGVIPLTELDISVEEAQQIINETEQRKNVNLR